MLSCTNKFTTNIPHAFTRIFDPLDQVFSFLIYLFWCAGELPLQSLDHWRSVGARSPVGKVARHRIGRREWMLRGGGVHGLRHVRGNAATPARSLARRPRVGQRRFPRRTLKCAMGLEI